MIKIDGYELEPCPFCGGDKLILLDKPLHGWFYVICTDIDCSAEGPVDLGKSGAVEKWNERVTK